MDTDTFNEIDDQFPDGMLRFEKRMDKPTCQ